MQPTHNILSENIRAPSVQLLNKHLAAAIDLQAQVKQAHWNVRGPGFIAVHELFDKVSEEVENYSDLIAERAGGLGGAAYGTVQVAAKNSFLVPYALDIADETEHEFAISGALAAFGQSVREAIGQATTFGDVDHCRFVYRNLARRRSAALVGRISYCAEKMKPSTSFADALSNPQS
jgi:starvation-inducible DNA-binding protein